LLRRQKPASAGQQLTKRPPGDTTLARLPHLVSTLLAVLAGGAVISAGDPQVSTPVGGPELVSVAKIWDRAPHNAFTDLIRWHGRWYCTFREADGHVGGDGKLRVLTSADGAVWEAVALVAEEGIDLRDPKLSVTPDDRLMLVAGGSVY